MRSLRREITRYRYRHIFAIVAGALVAGALVAGPTPARAGVSFDSVAKVLGSEGAFFNQVELSADASVEAHLFRTPGQPGIPERMRLAVRQGDNWRNHDMTPADLGSDRGSLGMSHDGRTIVVAYLRGNGAFVKLSTDMGVTWTDEKVLASGSSGRAWGVHTTVSANGQRIVLSWYQRVASKDTVHFMHSGDGGASWSEVIRPSDSGQVEQDVTSAVSYDGDTIALTWKAGGNATWGYHSFDGGVTWSLENLTEAVDAEIVGGSTDSNMPHVAVSGNGEAVSHVWSANGWTAIHAATTLDQGLSWLGTAITSEVSNAAWPRLAMDHDASHGVITWQDYTPVESAATLRLSRTSNSGADWTDSTMSQGGMLFSAPDIAMSTHGEVTAITWPEIGSGGLKAWSHFSINSGIDWITKHLSEEVAGNDARYPSVAVSADATYKAYSWIHDSGGSEHQVKTVTAATGVTPPATKPDAPTLTEAKAGNGSVTLTWQTPGNDGGSDITDYEYRLDGTGGWTSLDTTGTSATINGLTNDTTYSVEVRAVNSAGNSEASSIFTFTPTDPTPTDSTPTDSSPAPVDPVPNAAPDPVRSPAEPVTAPPPPVTTSPERLANITPQRLTRLKAAAKKLERKLKKRSKPSAMKLRFPLRQRAGTDVTSVRWQIAIKPRNKKTIRASKKWSGWYEGSLNKSGSRVSINLNNMKRVAATMPGSTVTVKAQAGNEYGRGPMSRAKIRIPNAAPTLPANG